MEKKANNKNREIKRLILVLVIIFLILGGFMLYLSIPLLTGTELILDTRPVDPFDPLRGQYIIINYEINNIPQFEGAEVGDKVYVALENDEGGIARYKSASLDKPKEGLFIKGTVKRLGAMRLEYGIEQFFFERNAELPTTNMTVKVKVDGSGRARILELLQNGEPMVIEYKDPSLTS